MKIDFSAPIMSLSGRPIKDNDATQEALRLLDTVPPTTTVGQIADMLAEHVAKNPESVITLGKISVQALTDGPDNTKLPGQKKFERFKLSLVADKGGLADITLAQAEDLKNAIGVAYGPKIVGRAWELIEAVAPPKCS